MPVHVGNGIALGTSAGEAAHTLAITEIPAHNHPATAQTTANTASPAGAIWAASAAVAFTPTADTVMNSAAVSSAGSGRAHENQAPFLTVNFVVALQGIFPSRN